MSKHIQGNAIPNATSYELYENGTQGVTMKLTDVPNIVFYINKTPTQNSWELSDSTSSTGGYTFDLPLQEDYKYHIDYAVRSWTLDAEKKGIETFNLTTEKSNEYTAKAGDVYLRSVIGNINCLLPDMTITITGSQVKRSVHSVDAMPIVEASGFIFYDNQSPSSSSANLDNNDTWWSCDIDIDPTKIYEGLEWGGRCWTFDAQGNALRTFRIDNDFQGVFTPNSNEVKLRIGGGDTRGYIFDKTYKIKDKVVMDNIDFDLSKRYYDSGSHTLAVKAKAAGYEDSDSSNSVTYTV